MNHLEIPLLRESAAFARRLIEASRSFGESPYQFHRRVNWSHRYCTQFYQTESDCFQSAPGAYLAGRHQVAPQLEDVLALRLGPKQVAKILLKVAAHWLFYVLGRLADGRVRRSGATIYRKSYVDEIELVFDPDQLRVVRAVYPFPINLGRQLRYLRYLHDKGHPFKLDGNPYSPKDLLRFLLRRDLRSLSRMESRAQVRHAHEVVALGVRSIQLSDEFDIGSLDFCRTLARFPVHVVNSAHGVGKYLPVHAYQEFHVITERQAQYYYATRSCRYSLRRLNDKAGTTVAPLPGAVTSAIRFIFLSQMFAGVSDIIANNEARVVERLVAEFAGSPQVKLLYRPHPNSHRPVVPKGFERLRRLEDVNGQPSTLFASFFSTCQIDPAFKGRKILLRGELLHPEIAFDASETIFDLNELVAFIKREAGSLGAPSDVHHTSNVV